MVLLRGIIGWPQANWNLGFPLIGQIYAKKIKIGKEEEEDHHVGDEHLQKRECT
jgi:hypothetical protein